MRDKERKTDDERCETCQHWEPLTFPPERVTGWCGSEDGRATLGVPKGQTDLEREKTPPTHWCKFHEAAKG